eukprot:11809087-Alexandrium_andersonii.AAC.1
MGASEACCERIGSLMDSLWNKRASPDPGALLTTVLLRESNVRCIGGERDERLCRDVARALVQLGRCHPVGNAKAQRRLLKDGVAA